MLLANPRVDPSANGNYAIRYAAFFGHTEIVKLLLADPRVDPSANNNQSLRSAINLNQVKVINLLLADSRIKINPRDIGIAAVRNSAETSNILRTLYIQKKEKKNI